jgi:hypothetical protein
MTKTTKTIRRTIVVLTLVVASLVISAVPASAWWCSYCCTASNVQKTQDASAQTQIAKVRS